MNESTVSPDLLPPATAAAGESYHPLCLDIATDDFWGRIDQVADWFGQRVNPILIKEARQALKSRQFTWTFFSLLIATWFWSLIGVLWSFPGIYFVPSGSWMLTGYYLILALSMIATVPLAAHQSLAAELDDGTFEMLAITRLTSRGIVLGKLWSAFLQMLIYFAAIVPSLAFSYLLRGVDLLSIGMILAVVFFTATLLTCFGLLLGATAVNRAARLAALLALLGVVFIAEIACGTVCLSGLLAGEIPLSLEVVYGFGIFFLNGIMMMVLFLLAAIARIAPVVENRSTRLRWCMFGQQLLWVFSILWLALAAKEMVPINLGIVALGGYWLLMGTLMLAESPDLSPRVQRGLPQTFLGRMLLTCFNPGPGSGFVFAIASACGGTIALGAFGLISIEFRGTPTIPLTMTLLMTGYLMLYLGLARLLLLILQRITERSFALAALVMVFLLLMGMLGPACVDVITMGAVSNYGLMHVSNWAWTVAEAFDSRGLDFGYSLVLWSVGICVLMVNLFFLFREMAFRRVAAPSRVVEADASPVVVEPIVDPLA